MLSPDVVLVKPFFCSSINPKILCVPSPPQPRPQSRLLLINREVSGCQAANIASFLTENA